MDNVGSPSPCGHGSCACTEPFRNIQSQGFFRALALADLDSLGTASRATQAAMSTSTTASLPLFDSSIDVAAIAPGILQGLGSGSSSNCFTLGIGY